MPSVTRQIARAPTARPGAAVRPRNNGATDADVWGSVAAVRMLLYGQSGTGKTTLWATFPGPILCLLCSGSDRPGELKSVDTPEYRLKITPLPVTSLAEFHHRLAGAADYATIVLDHASGFADVVLGGILGAPVPEQKGWGIATQQQYGQLAAQCKDAFRKLLNLPGNVVIVAQERVFGGRDDGDDPDIIRPIVGAALIPSLTGWLNPACDYVVQTYKRPRTRTVERSVAGKVVVTTERDRGVDYCLRTEPHEIYQTKFRLPRGRPLPECIVDPDYDKILALTRGDG